MNEVRAELDRAWTEPTEFDFAWVGMLNTALRWMLWHDMSIPPHLLNEVKKCFNSNVGAAAAARRTGLPVKLVEECFVALRSAPKTEPRLLLGDPPPDRSALV